MLQFMDWSVRLAETNKRTTEAATYFQEVLTKCSVEEFRKPLDTIIEKYCVRQLSSRV